MLNVLQGSQKAAAMEESSEAEDSSEDSSSSKEEAPVKPKVNIPHQFLVCTKFCIHLCYE